MSVMYMIYNIYVKKLMLECNGMEREERATRASLNGMERNFDISL